MTKLIKSCQELVAELISKKAFIIPLLLAALVAHGLRITSFAMSADDFDDYSPNHMLNFTYYISQNRWGIALVNGLFGCGQTIPFYNAFLSTLFLVIAALAWCVLIKKMAPKTTTPSLLIFGSVFVTFPIFCETLMFPASFAAPCAYAFIALGLTCVAEWLFSSEREKSVLIVGVLILALCVSIYEAFVSAYLVGVFVVLLLRQKEKSDRMADVIKYLFVFALVLVAAIIAREVIGRTLMLSLGIKPAAIATRTITWFSGEPVGTKLLLLVASLGGGYLYYGLFYYPVFAFALVSMAALACSLVISLHRRNPVLFLLTAGMVVANFMLAVVQGIVTPYRACTGFSILVSFFLMAGFSNMAKPYLKIAAGCALFFVVLFQAKETTLWTQNENHVFDIDRNNAALIGKELKENFGPSMGKPVVFVGRQAMYPYLRDSSPSAFDVGAPRLFDSPLCNGESFFMRGADDSCMAYELFCLFKFCGYVLKEPTAEQRADALEKIKSLNIPVWPEKGSMREMDDCIVVRIGPDEGNFVGRRAKAKEKLFEFFSRFHKKTGQS